MLHKNRSISVTTTLSFTVWKSGRILCEGGRGDGTVLTVLNFAMERTGEERGGEGGGGEGGEGRKQNGGGGREGLELQVEPFILRSPESRDKAAEGPRGHQTPSLSASPPDRKSDG